MEKITQFIGNILQISLWISVLLLLGGGIDYLIHHGHDNVNYHVFIKPSAGYTGCIQLGLFTLVLAQILRVLFTLWHFITLRDTPFALMSGYILILIIFSLV